jgi:hypothetical protein
MPKDKSKETTSSSSDFPLLTQQRYYESRPYEVQRAMNYNNKQKRISAFVPLIPKYNILRAIDINGDDAYFVMENLKQTGFTSVPKEGDIIPWQMQPPPVSKILCSEPLSPIPGVPTYQDYIAEHGEFPIPVSIDADDYPPVKVWFKPMDWAGFLALKDALSKLVAESIKFAVLNHEFYNLLPAGTDDVDVTRVDEGGVLFPQLADMRKGYVPGVSRFAVILNLDANGTANRGPLAYWADDVALALEDKGPLGVLALAEGR